MFAFSSWGKNNTKHNTFCLLFHIGVEIKLSDVSGFVCLSAISSWGGNNIKQCQ